MDALSQFVRIIEPAGSVDLRCRFAGHWQVPHEPAAPGLVPYHLVLDGEALIDHPGGRMKIVAGDIVLFPRGTAHTVRSLLGTELPIVAQVATRTFNGAVTELTLPQGEHALDLLCGSFMLGETGTALLQGLPDLQRIATAGREDCAWLLSLVAMLRHETASPSPGSSVVIGEISTALFTLLLRVLVARGELHGSALALLTHPRMAAAVEAVLVDPAHPWTVAMLAARCHLARATFARQFGEVGGLTPMAFLTAVRMQRAAQLLRSTQLSLDAIAERCGYRSPAAFARLFKAAHGLSPGRHRRAQQPLPAEST